mmetsp:Transcript_1510/g.3250  ORF Transcript_1510/g.3250 Transcript_1510/m.3250 type:complete len:327 (+) Transcript_1510:255-1235(+)
MTSEHSQQRVLRVGKRVYAIALAVADDVVPVDRTTDAVARVQSVLVRLGVVIARDAGGRVDGGEDTCGDRVGQGAVGVRFCPARAVRGSEEVDGCLASRRGRGRGARARQRAEDAGQVFHTRLAVQLGMYVAVHHALDKYEVGLAHAEDVLNELAAELDLGRRPALDAHGAVSLVEELESEAGPVGSSCALAIARHAPVGTRLGDADLPEKQQIRVARGGVAGDEHALALQATPKRVATVRREGEGVHGAGRDRVPDVGAEALAVGRANGGLVGRHLARLHWPPPSVPEALAGRGAWPSGATFTLADSAKALLGAGAIQVCVEVAE